MRQHRIASILATLSLCLLVATAARGEETRRRIPLKKARIPIGVLQGSVTDVKGRLVGAKLMLVDTAGSEILVPLDPNTGEFELKLAPGKYRLKATAPEYIGLTLDIEIKDKYRAKLPIKLKPVPPKVSGEAGSPKAPAEPIQDEVTVRYDRDTEIGDELDESQVSKIELQETVNFSKGEILLDEAGAALLDKLATLLQKDSSIVRIELIGHSHPTGNEGVENRNALRRATYAKNHLVSKGVDQARIRIGGEGSKRPKVQGDTPEAIQQNNRVEIILWKQKSQ